MAFLPFATKFRGPALPPGKLSLSSLPPFRFPFSTLSAILQPTRHLVLLPPYSYVHWLTLCVIPDQDRPDIITEALDLFRANSLFRNFEIKGPADRVLIYLILFIGDCLSRIGTRESSFLRRRGRVVDGKSNSS